MFSAELDGAVQEFTALMLPLSESDLERAWKWKDHDSEGVRFGFFVTLQELRQLSVTLSRLQPQPTQAQLILAQYHAAYLDLQAAVLGLSNGEADREPAEGEWSIRRVYSHILGTDLGFSAVVRYALEGHRAGHWTPRPVPDNEYPRLYGLSDEEYDELMQESFENLRSFHRLFHHGILREFRSIRDDELDLPSTFWEETRFPIRHRLHRYEAHFIQHTVQIEKTLAAIGQPPSESKRLLRRIYAALADVEGRMIAAEKMDDAAILETASSITNRSRQIRTLL